MSLDVQQMNPLGWLITRDVTVPLLGMDEIVKENIVETAKPFAIAPQHMPGRRVRIKQIGGTWLDI